MNIEDPISNPLPNETDKSIKKFSPFILIAATIFSCVIQIPFLFWPAGTFRWIEGWIYLGGFFIYMTLNVLILNKRNPEVLMNRMKTKKSSVSKAQNSDKWIFPLIIIFFVGLFLIPAFDFRYGWSNVPLWVNIFGYLGLGISFFLLFKTMEQNAYASKVLDIRKENGHKLIDTGFYGIVRHPMYTAFIIMAYSLVISLGSWYGLIISFSFSIVLAIRIKFEEQMLIEGLEGYEEYKKKVKYKLIPKIY